MFRQNSLLPRSGGDLKYVDTTWSNSFSSAPVPGTNAFLLNPIGQGTDVTQRVGRILHMKAIIGQFVVAAGSTQAQALHCRITIVYDRQTNGAAANATDIWNNFSGSVGPVSLRNLNNRDRFKVIKEVHLTVPPVASTTSYGVPVTRWVTFKKRMLLPVLFNSAANPSTAADMQSGSLYLWLTTDIAGTGTNTPVLTGAFRVRFVDA